MWNALGTLSKWKKKSDACCIPVNDLNDFFASHVQNGSAPLDLGDFALDELPKSTLMFSCYKVKSCLRKMNKASCGHDGIPPWILRTGFFRKLAPWAKFWFYLNFMCDIRTKR